MGASRSREAAHLHSAPSDEGAVRAADWGRDFNLSSFQKRKDYWILSLRHVAGAPCHLPRQREALVNALSLCVRREQLKGPLVRGGWHGGAMTGGFL